MSKARLIETVSLGVVALALVAPCSAVAQTSDAPVAEAPSGNGQADEEVVISGYREQNARAIEVKRNATGVVESIVADDVLALPDQSTAEALRRIVGVSAEERNGDAEYIVVRGLAREYNTTTIDGVRLAGTDPDSEAVQLSLFPTSLGKRIDVRKTFTPELQAGAVGANINVRTRSAFDSRKPFYALQGRIGLFEHREAVGRKADPSMDVSATVARQFADGQLGVVLAAGYRRTNNFTYFPGIFSNSWDFYSDDLSVTSRDRYDPAVNPDKPVPTGTRMSVYTNEQERYNFYGKLEIRPNDDFYIAFSGLYFHEDDLEDRDDHYLYRNSASRPLTLTETTGSQRQGRIHVGEDYRSYINTNTNFMGQFSYDFGGGRELTGSFNTSRGVQRNPQTEFRFQTGFLNGNGYSYDYSGDHAIFTLLDPAGYTQPAQIPLQHLRFFKFDNSERLDALQLSYSDNYQRRDEGFGWSAGLVSRGVRRTRDYDASEYQRATGVNLFLDQFDREGVTYAHPYGQLVGEVMYLLNRSALLDYFNANPTRFRNVSNVEGEALESDFRIKQSVDAVFLAGSYRVGDLNLSGGVRYERTFLNSGGYQNLVDTNPATPAYPWVTVKRDYDNWLPSFLAEYDATPEFKIRFAASRSLGRPNYAHLRVNGIRNVDTSRRIVTLSSGNPDVKPRQATSLDLSFEYYPSGFDGFASLGFFHKWIQDDIFVALDSDSEVIGGDTYEVRATRPTNALDSTLSGVEAGFLVNDLEAVSPWLAHFGIKANFSYITSDAKVLMADGSARKIYGLRGQPRTVGNFEFFYENTGFDIRAVYNHRGRYINAINTTRRFGDIFSNQRDAIDLKARYAITKNVKLFGEARNITGFAQDETWDEDFNRIIYTRDDGRSYWLGVSFRF